MYTTPQKALGRFEDFTERKEKLEALSGGGGWRRRRRRCLAAWKWVTTMRATTTVEDDVGFYLFFTTIHPAALDRRRRCGVPYSILNRTVPRDASSAAICFILCVAAAIRDQFTVQPKDKVRWWCARGMEDIKWIIDRLCLSGRWRLVGLISRI